MDSILSRNWVCQNLLDLIAHYPSGVTEAIIYSEMELQVLYSHTYLMKLGEVKLKIFIID